MWRAKPLAKMALRMFCFSAAIFTVTHTLINFLYIFGGQSLILLPRIALDVAAWSVTPAIVLALPLPVVTALFFRDIRRPAFYRFTMLTVALIATIAVWAEDYDMLGQMLKYNWDYAGFAAGTFVGNSLAVFMSYIVAGKYLPEAAEQLRQHSENKNI